MRDTREWTLLLLTVICGIGYRSDRLLMTASNVTDDGAVSSMYDTPHTCRGNQDLLI
jgi:hypothetical protein